MTESSWIVAIETSGPEGSVAVGRGEEVAAAFEFPAGLVHGREVIPRLKALCEQVGLSPRSISRVAVDVGPGSYTGLRIGIAAAKAIAYSTGAATLGISAFTLMAENAMALPAGSRLVPVRDARRGQVYAALFAREETGMRRIVDDFIATPDEAVVRILAETPATVIGDGAMAYPAVFAPPRFVAGPSRWATPSARTLISIAAKAFARGEATPLESMRPLYLQASEPEKERKDPG